MTEQELNGLEINAKHWSNAGIVKGEGLITLPAKVLLDVIPLARKGLTLQREVERLEKKHNEQKDENE